MAFNKVYMPWAAVPVCITDFNAANYSLDDCFLLLTPLSRMLGKEALEMIKRCFIVKWLYINYTIMGFPSCTYL